MDGPISDIRVVFQQFLRLSRCNRYDEKMKVLGMAMYDLWLCVVIYCSYVCMTTYVLCMHIYGCVCIIHCMAMYCRMVIHV
jgi:hypothetical protein